MSPERLLAPIQPGERLASRYQVLRLIGVGARKQVHLALDTALDREVAVCGLRTASQEDADRLRREAALLARLGDHPSVVTVHDLLEVDGYPVMVCQYLPGGSLQEVVEDAPRPVARALALATDVAAALAHAHQHDVIHRDVKPANIWRDEQGRGVLGDFGLAVAPHLHAHPWNGLVGTAAYAAPEQLVGGCCDARSDLYSLGAVLFQLLVGRPPFREDSVHRAMTGAVQEQPTAPSALRRGVPAEIDELVLSLLAKDPQDRPGSAEEVVDRLTSLRGAGERSSRAPRQGFVGRGPELQVLREALERAAVDTACLTLLLGEAGVGKTRLVLELAHSAAAEGWTVLTGRCHGDATVPSFWPWTQALQAALRDLSPEQRDALPQLPLLSSLVPDLAGGAGGGDREKDVSRQLLFDAVADLLRELSRQAPVVVLVDDAHWMDPASLALTLHVCRVLGDSPVALVLAARDPYDEDDGGTTVPALAQAAERTLRLGGLTETETASFLETALQLPLTPGSWLLHELHERTDGNPFYLAELVRLLRSEDRVTPDGVVLLPAEQTVPSSVRGVLHRRLQHITPACAELLQVMSVLGRQVALPLLANVAQLEPGQALQLLDEAVEARLVVEVPGPAAEFRFAHALVREALYDELRATRRAQLHRRAMNALLEMHTHAREAPAAELAHHAVHAAVDGDVAPAVAWSLRAGRAAALAAAHEDAVLHLGRAVELAVTVPLPLPDVPGFGELLLELGDAQRRLGQSEQARLTFMRAAGEAITGDDPQLLARSALGYGLGLGGFGYVAHADGVLLSLLEEALAALGEEDSSLRMRVLARLSTELYFTPFRSRRLLLSRQALEMAQRLGNTTDELLAVYSRTMAVLGPDHLDERRRTADRVIWLARTLADPEMSFRGHHLRLMAILETGSLEQARAEAASCRRIADQHRQSAHLWQATVFEAMLALADGRHDEALALSTRGLEEGRRGSTDMAQVMHGAQLLVVHWAQGRLAGLLDGVRAFADDYPYAPAWRAALAFCLTELERFDEARAELDVMAARDFTDIPEDGNFLATAGLLAHTAARLGDVARSRQLEEKLRPYADRHVVIAAGAVAFTSLRLALGAVRAACGDLDAAVRDVTAAHELHQARGTPAYAVWSAEELVRLLLARRRSTDLDVARETLAEALPVARALGMRSHVSRLERLADEMGGPELAARDAQQDAVTVLISDVAGSTALTERLGERAAHALLSEHRRAVETVAREQGGLVLKALGDAVLSVFPSADAALHCSTVLQQHFDDDTRSPVHVRIAVHTGPVLRQGDSMYGRTMIVAFRVADRALAGDVVVTAEARAAARTSWRFDAPELVQMKGIAEPQEVARLRWRPPAP